MEISTINETTKHLVSDSEDPFSVIDLAYDIAAAFHVYGRSFAFTPATVNAVLEQYRKTLDLLPKINWSEDTVKVGDMVFENHKLQACCSFLEPQVVEISKIDWALELYGEELKAHDDCPEAQEFIVAIPHGVDQFLCISDPRVLKKYKDKGFETLLVYVIMDRTALYACARYLGHMTS